VQRDTIRTGEKWIVSGTGYAPHEKISVSVADVVIGETSADDSGAFAIELQVSSSWGLGVKKLSVNGEIRPRPILVMKDPLVYPIADFVPPVLRFGDSLLVRGRGFIPGETIKIYLDSILISNTDTIKVRDDYSFESVVRMPYIADRKYQLAARGELSGRAVSPSAVYITRTLEYEFEDNVPAALWSGDTLFSENLSYRWYAKWSKQGIASYVAKASGDSVRFMFSLPVRDTFDVHLLLSVGKKYGKFSYSLDDKHAGAFDGYKVLDPNWMEIYPSDTLKLGTYSLAEGIHSFSFVSNGKNDNASGLCLGADLLLLTPTTKLQLAQGTILDTSSQLSVTPYNGDDIAETFIYPNPSSQRMATVGLHFLQDTESNSSLLDITLFDPSGKEIMKKIALPFGTDSIAKTKLDIHTLPAADYFIVFTLRTPKETRRYSQLLTVVR
jgi:hypothetical protein